MLRSGRGRRKRACLAGTSPAAYSTPGSTAYLDAKARGDSSMPVKQWPAKGVRGGALQDPRDMAKAGLLDAQSPAVKMTTHRNDAWNRCTTMSRLEPGAEATSVARGAVQRGRSRR